MLDTSKLISNSSSADRQADANATLVKVTKKTVSLTKFFKDRNKKKKNEIRKEQIEDVKEEREEEEKRLEKPSKNEEKKKVKVGSVKKLGILGWFKNFIGTTILGFFAVRLIEHLPKLQGIATALAAAAEFAIDIGGKLLNGLTTFIDIGYKAYDFTIGALDDIGGDKFVNIFNGLIDKISFAIDAIIIATLISGKGGIGQLFKRKPPKTPKPRPRLKKLPPTKPAASPPKSSAPKKPQIKPVKVISPKVAKTPAKTPAKAIQKPKVKVKSKARLDIRKAARLKKAAPVLARTGARTGAINPKRPFGDLVSRVSDAKNLAKSTASQMQDLSKTLDSTIEETAKNFKKINNVSDDLIKANPDILRQTAEEVISNSKTDPVARQAASNILGGGKATDAFDELVGKPDPAQAKRAANFRLKADLAKEGISMNTAYDDLARAVKNVDKELKSKPVIDKIKGFNVKTIANSLRSAGPTIVVDLALNYAAEKLILEPLEYQQLEGRRKKIDKFVRRNGLQAAIDKAVTDYEKENEKKPISWWQNALTLGFGGIFDKRDENLLKLYTHDLQYLRKLEEDPELLKSVKAGDPEPGLFGNLMSGIGSIFVPAAKATTLDESVPPPPRTSTDGQPYKPEKEDKVDKKVPVGIKNKKPVSPSKGSELAGELGRWLNSKQLRWGSGVTEHPEHGGVHPVHSPNSYHYKEQGYRAIDIGGWGPKRYKKEGQTGVDDQTKILAGIAEWNKMKGVSPIELIHEGNDYAGHNDHVHVAYKKGGLIPRNTRAFLHKDEIVIDKDSSDPARNLLLAINEAKGKEGIMRAISDYAPYDDNSSDTIIINRNNIIAPPPVQPQSGSSVVVVKSGFSDPFEHLDFSG